MVTSKSMNNITIYEIKLFADKFLIKSRRFMALAFLLLSKSSLADPPLKGVRVSHGITNQKSWQRLCEITEDSS